jgi:hypothetical protein
LLKALHSPSTHSVRRLALSALALPVRSSNSIQTSGSRRKNTSSIMMSNRRAATRIPLDGNTAAQPQCSAHSWIGGAG